MDQGGLPAYPSKPSWHVPRRPQGEPWNQEGGGTAPLCSVEPQRPQHFHFGMEGIERALRLSHLPGAGHY